MLRTGISCSHSIGFIRPGLIYDQLPQVDFVAWLFGNSWLESTTSFLNWSLQLLACKILDGSTTLLGYVIMRVPPCKSWLWYPLLFFHFCMTMSLTEDPPEARWSDVELRCLTFCGRSSDTPCHACPSVVRLVRLVRHHWSPSRMVLMPRYTWGRPPSLSNEKEKIHTGHISAACQLRKLRETFHITFCETKQSRANI